MSLRGKDPLTDHSILWWLCGVMHHYLAIRMVTIGVINANRRIPSSLR